MAEPDPPADEKPDEPASSDRPSASGAGSGAVSSPTDRDDTLFVPMPPPVPRLPRPSSPGRTVGSGPVDPGRLGAGTARFTGPELWASEPGDTRDRVPQDASRPDTARGEEARSEDDAQAGGPAEAPPDDGEVGGPSPAAADDGTGADDAAASPDHGDRPAAARDEPDTIGFGGNGAAAAHGPARGSFLRELPLLLLVALVLAFLLRTFVVQVFYIPSSSMEPTLQRDDRMVVEKVTYRFRDPRHGEILVFEGESLGAPPADEGVAARVLRGVGQFLGVVPVSARDFVKRVVALPGDELELVDGVVFVNGQALDEPYVLHQDRASFGPIVVPDGELFFLGDNRPNSSDSRSSLGTVPLDHVVGRSVLIIWPFDHAGLLTRQTHEVPPPARADPGVGGAAAVPAD